MLPRKIINEVNGIFLNDGIVHLTYNLRVLFFSPNSELMKNIITGRSMGYK